MADSAHGSRSLASLIDDLGSELAGALHKSEKMLQAYEDVEKGRVAAEESATEEICRRTLQLSADLTAVSDWLSSHARRGIAPSFGAAVHHRFAACALARGEARAALALDLERASMNYRRAAEAREVARSGVMTAQERLKRAIEDENGAVSEARKAHHARAQELRDQIRAMDLRIANAGAERDAKGAAYEQDPAFAYLYNRSYGTPEYRRRVNRLIQAGDNMLASALGYQQAARDYALLKQIPDWLADRREALATDLMAHQKAESEIVTRTISSDEALRALNAAVLVAEEKARGLEAGLTAAATELSEAEALNTAFNEWRDRNGESMMSILQGAVALSSEDELRPLVELTESQDDDVALSDLLQARARAPGANEGLRMARRAVEEGRARIDRLEGFRVASAPNLGVEIAISQLSEARRILRQVAGGDPGEEGWRALESISTPLASRRQSKEHGA